MRSKLETLGGLFAALCTLEPWLLLIIGCWITKQCIAILDGREVSDEQEAE